MHSVAPPAPAAKAPPAPLAAAHGVLASYDADHLLDAWPPAPPAPRSALFAWATFAVKRLRIFAVAVPISLFVVLIRWLNLKVGGNELPVEATMLPPLIAACSFVMAMVLSNVMADYKESEKIPAELTSYFNSIVCYARTEAAANGFDERPMLLNVQDMLLSVLATIDRKVEFSHALDTFNESFVAYSVCSFVHAARTRACGTRNADPNNPPPPKPQTSRARRPLNQQTCSRRRARLAATRTSSGRSTRRRRL